MAGWKKFKVGDRISRPVFQRSLQFGEVSWVSETGYCISVTWAGQYNEQIYTQIEVASFRILSPLETLAEAAD